MQGFTAADVPLTTHRREVDHGRQSDRSGQLLLHQEVGKESETLAYYAILLPLYHDSADVHNRPVSQILCVCARKMWRTSEIERPNPKDAGDVLRPSGEYPRLSTGGEGCE